MKYCKVCGASNEDNARFCTECGTPMDNDPLFVGDDEKTVHVSAVADAGPTAATDATQEKAKVSVAQTGASASKKERSFLASPQGIIALGLALAVGVGGALGLHGLKTPSPQDAIKTEAVAPAKDDAQGTTKDTGSTVSGTEDIHAKEDKERQELAKAEAEKEAAEKAAAEKAKADAEKAEAEKAKAEAEKAKADAEKAKAEAEKAKAEAEKARQEAEASSSSSGSTSAPSFPQTWNGSYTGHQYGSGYDNTFQRPITFHFTDIGSDGSLYGSVDIWVEEDGVTGSYYVSGYVDWESGYFKVSGTQWIDSSGLSNMRTFEGYVNSSRTYVSGSTWNSDGENLENWSASA